MTDPLLSKLPMDLGDGLVLRMGRPGDAETLIEFNTRVFDERITGWTRDVVGGEHPTVQPADFTVVEDNRGKAIVSSLCLISQTWACSGVPFRVGRAELVATNPEYRRRGLIRKQFEVLHALSAAKGELMQVVSGVPWFYRQFGYEMGINLAGNRCLQSDYLSKLSERGPEPFLLRPIDASDRAFVRELYGESMRHQVYAAFRSDREWEYEFTGRCLSNTRRREWLMVQTAQGERVGFVQYLPCLASPQWRMFRIYQVELRPGISYLNAAPSLLRGFWEKGKAMVSAGELACAELEGVELAMEREHPLFDCLATQDVRVLKPTPWYVRVPEMAAFLRQIRPALERRLVGTLAEGHSGELKVSFYRGGIRLKFERGQILAVEDWKPDSVTSGDARFPAGTFLHLVCGWRRVDEIAENYPDAVASQEAAVLLDLLFPPYRGRPWLLS